MKINSFEEIDIKTLDPLPTSEDLDIFRQITRTEITKEQEEIIKTPPESFPECRTVMAVHWHPETISMELIRYRISATFPNMKNSIIIPTQHNVMMSWDDYSGVEIDCMSKEFNRKIQLLIHMKNKNRDRSATFLNMLNHTLRYRSNQLYEFIDSALKPALEGRLESAAKKTGTEKKLILFIRHYMSIIKQLLDINQENLTIEMVKNRIVRDFFDCLRYKYSDYMINRCQVFLNELKSIVKDNFSLKYFYKAQDVISEARMLNGGIIIPHPEQFWPVLLTDYDVDGIEVWNPRSRQYSDFLIDVVNKKNRSADHKKHLLVFMGDDTHMSEKLRPPHLQDREKSGREIGIQAGWNDPSIIKSLKNANSSKAGIISEYKSRLE